MASTAAIIEAASLAGSLAALRGRPSPGLTEMNDASLSAICGGEQLPLRFIHERLIIGSSVGEVAQDVPQPPLQADLGKQSPQTEYRHSGAFPGLAFRRGDCRYYSACNSAAAYCEQKTSHPAQTHFIVISDLCEGCNTEKMLAAPRQ